AGSRPELLERLIVSAPGVGVASGVQLDCGDAQRAGRVDGRRLGIDEEAHPSPGLGEAAEGGAEAARRSPKIEAALGGDLLAALGHERGLVGTQTAREGEDVLAG